MRILVLSTSLLTNRLLSRSFFDKLGKSAEVTVWASSVPPFMPDSCAFKTFPNVRNNREWVNLLRRTNERAWAGYLSLQSILSLEKFNASIRPQSTRIRLAMLMGRIVAFLRLQKISDSIIKKLVRTQSRSVEARSYLESLQPDVLVVTNPFWMHESSIAIEAKKLGIKIFSIIPSWDNITTKSRLTFDSDMYFVWSEIRTKELLKIYPQSKSRPVYEFGTPQYECFFESDFHVSREEFCRRYGLDPLKKIVLYTTGSPNFLKTEYKGAELFSELFLSEANFGNCQLLIRPHPNKDNNELQYLHRPEEGVFVQFTANSQNPVFERSMNHEEIQIWVNTFRHCDIVITLSSTVLLDAMAFDKPVININFDPAETSEYQEFIKEINDTWHHLKEIRDCKEIPQANSFDELKQYCQGYLEDPNRGLTERKKVFHSICLDPRQAQGAKLAEAIVNKAPSISQS